MNVPALFDTAPVITRFADSEPAVVMFSLTRFDVTPPLTTPAAVTPLAWIVFALTL